MCWAGRGFGWDGRRRRAMGIYWNEMAMFGEGGCIGARCDGCRCDAMQMRCDASATEMGCDGCDAHSMRRDGAMEENL